MRGAATQPENGLLRSPEIRTMRTKINKNEAGFKNKSVDVMTYQPLPKQQPEQEVNISAFQLKPTQN